jgi:hypothetical protein
MMTPTTMEPATAKPATVETTSKPATVEPAAAESRRGLDGNCCKGGHGNDGTHHACLHAELAHLILSFWSGSPVSSPYIHWSRDRGKRFMHVDSFFDSSPKPMAELADCSLPMFALSSAA